MRNFSNCELKNLKNKDSQNRWVKAEIQMYEKVLENIDLIQKEKNNLKENEFIINLWWWWGYTFKKLDGLLIPTTYNFVWNQYLNWFIKLTFKD